MIELRENLAELLTREFRLAHLVTIELDEVSIYLTDAGHDVTYGGVVYQSGMLRKVPAIEVNGEVRVGEVSLQLSAVTGETTALFYQHGWMNRKLTIQRAYFEPDMTAVGAVKLYEGFLTGKSGEESLEKASLTLKVASVWADFSAVRGRRTNLKSQQMHHPDDFGFEFCGTVQLDMDWGQKSKSTPSNSGGGAAGGGRRPGEIPVQPH